MNDYFDQVEQGLSTAVRSRRHLPWYRRMSGLSRGRALVVVIAALVVATPAVGAVSHWFGFGAPDHFVQQSATQFAGRALPGTGRVLPVRFTDPQGGPPWGLKVVRTTRGDTCIQLGRVKDGRLGSLGIDDAWHDDHLFHPFPSKSLGLDCGTTDADGHAFVNVVYTGTVASADPTRAYGGTQPQGCRPLTSGGPKTAPLCPSGSTRIVFMGLLGPDATSITYQAPDGSLQRERTRGPDGAYLLVFTRDQRSCNLYTNGPFGGYGPCGGTESVGGANPDQIGAIKAINYRDGHSCQITMPPALATAYMTLHRQLLALGPPPFDRPMQKRLWAAFLAREHLKPGWVSAYENKRCPPVGYIAQKIKPVTHKKVAAPITVKLIRGQRWCSRKGRYRANTFSWMQCDGTVPPGFQRIDIVQGQPSYPATLVNISLTARWPVTSSRNSYQIHIEYPHGCQSGGTSGPLGFGNIHVGQSLRFQDIEARCAGTYHGTVNYLQNSRPGNQQAGIPDQGGSVAVGRFSYTLR